MPASADPAVSEEFSTQAETFRDELLAHCYRMTGSIQDAEDLVQETYLRAWRSYSDFEHRASLRTWLHRIATNVCLNALRRRDRRVLPSGLGPPSTDVNEVMEADRADVNWVEPLPHAMFSADLDDPATIAIGRESIRLALIASLQHLSPRQRAVLLLRDVLAWSAAEVAQTLDMNVGAVKSMLQRARRRLDEVKPRQDDVLEPSHPRARELLQQYMEAFETADAKAFERILRDDAVLEMAKSDTWFSGKRFCLPQLVNHVTGEPGAWRTLATAANGQPAIAAYHRNDDGTYVGFGVGVLTVTHAGVLRVTVFGDAELLARFDLPATLGSPPGPARRTQPSGQPRFALPAGRFR